MHVGAPLVDERAPRRARAWEIVTWVVAALAACATFATYVSSLTVCRGGLSVVALPAAWETLPQGPLAPFRFDGSQIKDLPGFPVHAYTEAWVFDPAACAAPRSGVEAERTYDEGSLRLRHDVTTDTFVVTGIRPDENGKVLDERSPLVAFRRSRVPNLTFESGRWRLLGVGLTIVLAAAFSLAARARRAIRKGTPQELGRVSTYGVLSLTLVFLTATAVVVGGAFFIFIDGMNAMSTYH